jgi:hypothetical protein
LVRSFCSIRWSIVASDRVTVVRVISGGGYVGCIIVS